VVAPLTGALASFAAAANWQIERWNEALADGVVCGDNKNHKIKVIQYDSQSDTNRAAQVAGDLVQNDGVDVILVSSSPDTVNPVADQCEALACP
jgi:branched-chain amino acid transport system substrate-binding protein